MTESGSVGPRPAAFRSTWRSAAASLFVQAVIVSAPARRRHGGRTEAPKGRRLRTVLAPHDRLLRLLRLGRGVRARSLWRLQAGQGEESDPERQAHSALTTMGTNAFSIAAVALVAAALCAPAHAAGILAPLNGHCRSEFARCGETDCMNALGCVAACEREDDCASRCDEGLTEEGGAALRSYRSCFRSAPESTRSGRRAANEAKPLTDGMRFRAKRVALARAKRVAQQTAALHGKFVSKIVKGTEKGANMVGNSFFINNAVKNLHPTTSDKRSTCLACAGMGLRLYCPPFAAGPALSRPFPACIGCLFVWEQVAPHVGKNPEFDDVANVFEQTCQDQPDIFYSACDDMYDAENKLVNTYLDQAKRNAFSADELCLEAQLCSPGLLE